MEPENVVGSATARELEEFFRWEDQAFFVESALFRHPRNHREVGCRRGPKGRHVDFDSPIRTDSIDAHRLDLQSDNVTVLQVAYRELHGLGVWKRSEQVQMLSLGELADNLRLPQETEGATPQPRKLLGNGSRGQAQRHAKSIHESIC